MKKRNLLYRRLRMRAGKFAAFAMIAVLMLGFSGCGFIRLFTGTQIRVQNETAMTLSAVRWGDETIASNVAPDSTTDYADTTITSGTLTVIDKGGVMSPYFGEETWEADYAGVYTIRVWAVDKITFGVEMKSVEGKVGKQ
jgi:hypothetical protein